MWIMVSLSRALDQFALIAGGEHSDRFFDRAFSTALCVCLLVGLIVAMSEALFEHVNTDMPFEMGALVLMTVSVALIALLLSTAVRAVIAAGRILHQRIR